MQLSNLGVPDFKPFNPKNLRFHIESDLFITFRCDFAKRTLTFRVLLYLGSLTEEDEEVNSACCIDVPVALAGVYEPDGT